MNTTANIIIILAFPQKSVQSLKELLYKKNRIFLFIEETLDILEIYKKIENFLKNNNSDIKSINIYNISFIYNNMENVLERNNGADHFSIENLISKIENECVNKNNQYVNVDKRKSIYINFLANDDDNKSYIFTSANKIILNYKDNTNINDIIIKHISLE